MKIALIGVPGSGKSALAEVLKRAIEIKDEADGCNCRTPVEVIDGYVGDVEQTTDLATGFLGGYLANWHVALAREVRERCSAATTTITCGTLLETTTYAAIDGASQVGQMTDEVAKAEEIRRLSTSMQVFAVLYQDTFDYDHAFYLPAINADNNEQVRQLDLNLQVAYQAFDLVKVHPLMVESDNALNLTEARCEEALRVIFKEDDESNDSGD